MYKNEDKSPFLTSKIKDNVVGGDVDYLKDKLAIILPKMSVKTKDKKEFFKSLFKLYDECLNNFSDDLILGLSPYYNIPTLAKVVSFLRFKKGLNYKERMAMVKELCDLPLDKIIYYEKMLTSSMYEMPNQALKGDNMDISIDGMPMSKDIIDTVIDHIVIYKNTLVLLKCVLYDYYKYDIVEVKDGKLQKKLLPVPKDIYAFNKTLEVSSVKLDTDRFLDVLLNLRRDMPTLDFSIEAISIALYTYIENIIINDEYNKILLDKGYKDIVKNRLNSLDKIYKTPMHSRYMVTRSVLLPKSGVILLVHDHPLVESILLKEVMFRGVNNLVFVVRYKDGTECVNSVVLDIDYSYVEWVCLSDAENEYILSTNNEGYYSLSYILHFLQGMQEELVYDIISPTYWKYRDNGYTSSKDKVDNMGIVVKREFDVEVAPFLRKINGECGKEAKELAKKLGIVLKDGYTIVKPHTRTYNKVRLKRG